GIAGNVPAEMPADRPRIGVIAGAGGRADDEAQLLAFVEISEGIRPRGRRRRRQGGDRKECASEPASWALHATSARALTRLPSNGSHRNAPEPRVQTLAAPYM